MNALVGTGQLIRLALRRDRFVLPAWVLVLAIIPASGAGAYDTLYDTPMERASLTGAMGNNPSLMLLYGPAYDLSNAGGFTAWRYGTIVPLFLALACIFTITRHTRAEEDTGRQELLSSGVLGRFAPLTAAFLVAGGVAIVTGLLTTGALLGAGLPTGSSLSYGLATASVGLVFTAIAAVTAQLAEYSRSANGIATGILGGTFLLRALGDSTNEMDWLSWLSPNGWATQVRAFSEDRWWVLLVPLAATIVLAVIGYVLLPRRDLGMGLFPSRPGPAVAAPGLRSPFALAWRLHRGVLIGWLIGFAVLGALFGSIAQGIGDLLGDSAQVKQMIERMGGTTGMVDAFLAAMIALIGMIAALYTVQATLRMRSEEVGVRVEPLLATRVRRLQWAVSHLVFALIGSALLLAVAGTGLGLLHGQRVNDVPGQLPSLLGACMAQLPAVWVVAAVAVLLFGFLPKYVGAAWTVAAFFLLLTLFGPVAQVDQLVLDISPFEHIPQLPSAEFTATPLLWLTGVAVVATGAGLAGFRRRDIG